MRKQPRIEDARLLTMLSVNSPGNGCFGIITRQVWLVYCSLSLTQHGMSEISRSVEVCAV